MSTVAEREDGATERALTAALTADRHRRTARRVLADSIDYADLGCLDAKDRRRAYAAWQYANVVSQPRAVARSAEELRTSSSWGDGNKTIEPRGNDYDTLPSPAELGFTSDSTTTVALLDATNGKLHAPNELRRRRLDLVGVS